jgi:hypothetical protein
MRNYEYHFALFIIGLTVRGAVSGDHRLNMVQEVLACELNIPGVTLDATPTP